MTFARRMLLVIFVVVFVAVGAVIFSVDWFNRQPHIDGIRLEPIARLLELAGCVSGLVVSLRGIRARRRAGRLGQ